VAGLTPRDVALVSLHGTGTPLGDPIEVGALGQAFAVGAGPPSTLTLGTGPAARPSITSTLEPLDVSDLTINVHSSKA
jgi:hypothetical protein